MKMFKLFYVPQDAIGPDGKIIRGTKLYPYYAHQYNVDDNSIREHVGNDTTAYDNNTNSHAGKVRFDLIVNDDMGDIYLRNMPAITSRGYSGESYWDKSNRDDSILDNWQKMSDFTEDDRHFIATLYHPDRVKDERNNINQIKSGLVDYIKHTMNHPFADVNTKQRLINVPLIVHADEDDLIRAHDILYNHFDAGRDDKGEIQLKKINRIEQPSSVRFRDTTPNDTAYYDRRLKGPNGEPPKALDIDIKEFFNNDFNHDDDEVWSDARLKSVVDNMYPGYTSYKNYMARKNRQQNITNGVKEFGQ